MNLTSYIALVLALSLGLASGAPAQTYAVTETSASGGGGGPVVAALDDLTDVSVPAPSDGQALVFNSMSGEWEAQNISAAMGGVLQGKTFVPYDRGEAGAITPLSSDGAVLGLPNTPSTLVESGVIHLADSNLLGSVSSTTGVGIAVPSNATHILIGTTYRADGTLTGGGEITDVRWLVDNVDGSTRQRRRVILGQGQTAEGHPYYAMEIDQSLPNLRWSLQTGPTHNANGALAQFGLNFLGYYIDEEGTAQELEGKTFIPVEVAGGPRSLGAIYNSVGIIGPGATVSGAFDLASAGGARTIPMNATHAKVKLQLDVNVNSGDGASTVYLESQNGSPAVDANNQVASVNGNAATEVNLTNTDGRVVPLNGGTVLTWLYAQANGVSPYDTASRNVQGWIEGWYIDDAGSVGEIDLDGLTFQADQRAVFATANDSSNKSGTFDISSPPSGAQYAKLKVLCSSDNPSDTFNWQAAAFNQAVSPGTFPAGSIGCSGQMDSDNNWHDVQGEVMVDVTGATLGRVGYEVTTVSGSIGAGTHEARFELIGWLVTDSAVSAGVQGPGSATQDSIPTFEPDGSIKDPGILTMVEVSDQAQVRADDGYMVEYNRTGTDGDYQVCNALGQPIQFYDESAHTHYVYYGTRQSGGAFVVTDWNGGGTQIERLRTGGAGGTSVAVRGSAGETFEVDALIPVFGSLPSCGPIGQSGKDTLCDDGGVLSVIHDTGSPISLEPPAPFDDTGIVRHSGQQAIAVVDGGGGPITAQDVTTLDVGTTGLNQQGVYFLTAEIVGGELGGGIEGGFYELRARITSLGGVDVPIIRGTTGTIKDDEDGAATGEDCAFTVSAGSIEVECVGFNNYTGHLRWEFAPSGAI